MRPTYVVKSKIIEEIDTLYPYRKHYIYRKVDLDDHLYRVYNKIEEIETKLIAAIAKKQALEAEKLTGDIYEKLYSVMYETEKRRLIESLISEVHIYEERQLDGQWIKSIKFKLPI